MGQYNRACQISSTTPRGTRAFHHQYVITRCITYRRWVVVGQGEVVARGVAVAAVDQQPAVVGEQGGRRQVSADWSYPAPLLPGAAQYPSSLSSLR